RLVRPPEGLLRDDRVERDRGLAGLAVADNQLALAAADRRHRVDRGDPRVERLLHRLARYDVGRLELQHPRALRRARSLVFPWPTQGVYDSPEEAVADRDREDLPGLFHRIALLDRGGV